MTYSRNSPVAKAIECETRSTTESLANQLADVTIIERAEKAEDFIRRKGYRCCDLAVCNCNSWHGGNAEERLQEISNAMSEIELYPKGNTILDALNELIAERDAAMKDAERYRWLAADGDRAQALLNAESGHCVEATIDAALAKHEP